MSIPLMLRAIQRNGLRAFTAAVLAGLAGCLAVFNVEGWLAEELYILAVLAAFFEALGFVFAVLVEDAVRAKRFDRALVCFAILAGAAAFNTVGGHRAWDASMATRQQERQRTEQDNLDRRRAELLDTAARAQAEIDRVPLPDPNLMTGRQQAARATWEVATADARRRKAAAEQGLSELPVIAVVAPPFDERVTWGFLMFLEIAKALGLWAIGMNVRAATATPARAAATFDPSEWGRRLVALRADRQAAAAT